MSIVTVVAASGILRVFISAAIASVEALEDEDEEMGEEYDRL